MAGRLLVFAQQHSSQVRLFKPVPVAGAMQNNRDKAAVFRIVWVGVVLDIGKPGFT
jgi:6-phosphogluconolactonase (cycloisomerase 2 family)